MLHQNLKYMGQHYQQEHVVMLGCKECNNVTPHEVKTAGTTTVYTCVKCGRKTERSGAIA